MGVLVFTCFVLCALKFFTYNVLAECLLLAGDDEAAGGRNFFFFFFVGKEM